MNWIKKYYVTIFIVFIILLSIEIILRLTDNVITVQSKIGYSDKIISEIYGPKKLNDYKTVFKEQSVRWSYSPFVEYKETPRIGNFVSVSEDNIRCNINGDSQCELHHGEKVIWVFGGSTTFGYSVKNDETIPAYLQKSLPEYKVVNMGHAAYYSTQERILFNEKLALGIRPEIAVFIDGLNDFHFYHTPDKSVISDSMDTILSNSKSNHSYELLKIVLLRWLKKSFLIKWVYSISKPYELENTIKNTHIQSDNTLNAVIERLRFNIEARSNIGKENGIKVLNVLQPVPTFGAGHSTSKVPNHLITFGYHLNSARGYELIEEGGLQADKFKLLDLKHLSIKSPMYIDSVHYSPSFNREIALQIKNSINIQF